MLNGTYDYYSRIGESALQVHYSQQKSFEAYMKYIQIKLSEETRRAILLPAHTKDEIMQLCYKALIEKHMHIFQSEFQVIAISLDYFIKIVEFNVLISL